MPGWCLGVLFLFSDICPQIFTNIHNSQRAHTEQHREHTEKHREAQRSTGKHRETQGSTEKNREAQRSTEKHREARRSTQIKSNDITFESILAFNDEHLLKSTREASKRIKSNDLVI